jgi:hypothetical protein
MTLAFLHAEKVYGDAAIRDGSIPTQESRRLLAELFAKEGKGYTLEQFLRDSGAVGADRPAASSPESAPAGPVATPGGGSPQPGPGVGGGAAPPGMAAQSPQQPPQQRDG